MSSSEVLSSSSCPDPNVSATTESPTSQTDVGLLLDSSIVSFSALKAIATGVSLPLLHGASDLLVNILKTVQAAQANQEALKTLAKRAVFVVGTLQEIPELHDIEATTQTHWKIWVTPLESALKAILDYARKHGKRKFFVRAVRTTKIAADISQLEKDLNSAHQLFHSMIQMSINKRIMEQSRSISRIETQLMNSNYIAYEKGLPIYNPDDFETCPGPLISPGYHIFTAKRRSDSTFIVVKTFVGSHAQERHQSTLQGHRYGGIWHDNIRRVIGTSRPGFSKPFLILSGSTVRNVIKLLAYTIHHDLEQAMFLGLRLVAGVSAALEYLAEENFPLAQLTAENIDLQVEEDDRVLIDLTEKSISTSRVRENSSSMDILNAVCEQAVRDVNELSYGEAQYSRIFSEEQGTTRSRFLEPSRSSKTIREGLHLVNRRDTLVGKVDDEIVAQTVPGRRYFKWAPDDNWDITKTSYFYSWILDYMKDTFPTSSPFQWLHVSASPQEAPPFNTREDSFSSLFHSLEVVLSPNPAMAHIDVQHNSLPGQICWVCHGMSDTSKAPFGCNCDDSVPRCAGCSRPFPPRIRLTRAEKVLMDVDEDSAIDADEGSEEDKESEGDDSDFEIIYDEDDPDTLTKCNVCIAQTRISPDSIELLDTNYRVKVDRFGIEVLGYEDLDEWSD